MGFCQIGCFIRYNWTIKERTCVKLPSFANLDSSKEMLDNSLLMMSIYNVVAGMNVEDPQTSSQQFFVGPLLFACSVGFS